MCGASLAVINFAKIWLVDKLLLGTSGITVTVDLVINLTLFVEIIFLQKNSGLHAADICQKKLKFDPAVMSSPFITTIIDALSLFDLFRLGNRDFCTFKHLRKNTKKYSTKKARHFRTKIGSAFIIFGNQKGHAL
ncbi:MAG: magnesium transporter [Anaerotruncus sp.]|nr:MAG: magnesium transporter [Anaerotruncus sp.]